MQEGFGCLEHNNSHLNATVYALQNGIRTSQLKFLVVNTSDCSPLSSCKIQINISHFQAQYYYLQLHIILKVLFEHHPSVHQYSNEIRKYNELLIHNDHLSNFLADFLHQEFSYTLNVTDGVVSAFCTSSIRNVNYCTIQFSRDPSYSNLTTPTIGPVNVLFQFPFMETSSSSTYYHQATLNVDSTYTIVVQSSDVISFPNGETFPGTSVTESSATEYTTSRSSITLTIEFYQLGLIALLLFIALATCCGITLCFHHRGM